MKLMNNDDIKKVSLEILSDVHDFCVANNLHYSLAYGTLIGAVRHKGFIPWDDDIDIIMPRKDYERFFKLYKSDRFQVSCPSLNNSYLFFGRVYDTKTYVKAWRPQTTLQNTGVWIDVFPIDYVPNELGAFENEVSKISSLYKISHYKRMALQSFCEVGFRHVKTILKLLADKIKTNSIDLLKTVAEADEIAKTNINNSDFMGAITCHVYSHKEHIPSHVFSEFIDVPFEGKLYKSVKDYDVLLSNYYGNYMQLPPIEKRVFPHSAHKFYWK